MTLRFILGATPTGGTVRNATHNRNRTQFCVSPLASKQQEPYAILRTKSMSEQNVVGRASLDRLTSQEEQHEGKAEFNISVKI